MGLPPAQNAQVAEDSVLISQIKIYSADFATWAASYISLVTPVT